VGFNLGKGRTNFFAEANYRYADSEVTYSGGGVRIVDDLEIGGFGVNVGVLWTF
jgi:hypothetical protein